MKLLCLFFIFGFQSTREKGIEGFSQDDYDKCEDLGDHYCNDQNTYHDDPCSGQCHHQEFDTFLKSSPPQIKSFKKCCRKNEYTYEDNCDSRQTYLQRRCGAPNTISRPIELNCPKHCHVYNAVQGGQLDLDKNQGTVQLKDDQNKNATINDFCAAYECKDEPAGYDYYEDEPSNVGYQMVFHICVCAKKEVLKKEIKESKIPQCCPKSYITNHDEGNKLNCPGGDDESQGNKDLLTCLTDNFIADDQHMVNETHYSIKSLTDFGKTESHALESNNFCIGQTFEDVFQSDISLLKQTLFHCQQSPCTPGNPCLR